jgi:hypothetical protein
MCAPIRKSEAKTSDPLNHLLGRDREGRKKGEGGWLDSGNSRRNCRRNSGKYSGNDRISGCNRGGRNDGHNGCGRRYRGDGDGDGSSDGCVGVLSRGNIDDREDGHFRCG